MPYTKLYGRVAYIVGAVGAVAILRHCVVVVADAHAIWYHMCSIDFSLRAAAAAGQKDFPRFLYRNSSKYSCRNYDRDFYFDMSENVPKSCLGDFARMREQLRSY